MTFSKKVSLSEVNQSVDTPNNNRFWQNLKTFEGPGALVAVEYMDQGNWKKRSRDTGYGTTDSSWSGRPDEPQTQSPIRWGTTTNFRGKGSR